MLPFILERDSLTGGETCLTVEQVEGGDIVILIEQDNDSLSFVLKGYEVEEFIAALEECELD